MRKIRIGNINRFIHNDWNRLKKHELLELAHYAISSPTEMEIKSKFFLYLTNLSIVVGDNPNLIVLCDKDKKTYPVTHPQFTDMVNTLDFLFHKTDDVFTFKSKLTKNLIPNLKAINLLYYGPKEGLTDISFAEFIEAERHYINYTKERKEKDLNKLVATLYRPETKFKPENGNFKMPFHEEVVESRAIVFQMIEPEIKFAVLLFYEGCRRHLTKLFPKVFSARTTPGKKSIYGMAEVINGLCNDDPTQFEKVEATRLYVILLHLEKRIEMADELNQKYRKR